jgi:hypothetical protein
MNRLVLATALVALFAGVLGGFFLWGLPARHARTELAASQETAERIGKETADLRKELAAEKSRRQALEREVRNATEMNSRLNLLVSQSRK